MSISCKMSAFKFLIDTNIVIGLEDNRPVDAGLTELTCFIHGAMRIELMGGDEAVGLA